MSNDAFELLQRWIEAFNARDLDALDELIAPDFEFLPYLATLIEAGVYRGHDGLREYYDDADAAWESIQVRMDDSRVVGDVTVAWGELRGKGRASGLDVRVELASVIESRDGRVIRIATYESTEAALDAARLRQ